MLFEPPISTETEVSSVPVKPILGGHGVLNPVRRLSQWRLLISDWSSALISDWSSLISEIGVVFDARLVVFHIRLVVFDARLVVFDPWIWSSLIKDWSSLITLLIVCDPSVVVLDLDFVQHAYTFLFCERLLLAWGQKVQLVIFSRNKTSAVHLFRSTKYFRFHRWRNRQK